MCLRLYLQAISPGSFPRGERTSHPSWRVGRSMVVELRGLSWDQKDTSMCVPPFPRSVSHQPVPKRLMCSLEPFLQERAGQHPKKQVWMCPAALWARSSPSRKPPWSFSSSLTFCLLSWKKSKSCTDCSRKDLHVQVGIPWFTQVREEKHNES